MGSVSISGRSCPRRNVTYIFKCIQVHWAFVPSALLCIGHPSLPCSCLLFLFLFSPFSFFTHFSSFRFICLLYRNFLFYSQSTSLSFHSTHTTRRLSTSPSRVLHLEASPSSKSVPSLLLHPGEPLPIFSLLSSTIPLHLFPSAFPKPIGLTSYLRHLSCSHLIPSFFSWEEQTGKEDDATFVGIVWKNGMLTGRSSRAA